MTVHVTRLQAEYRPEAFGIGTPIPRLSWTIGSDAPGLTQTAYEIEIVHPDASVESTGRVDSTEQVFVRWPFAPLSSREAVTARVRVWASDASVSGWSAPLPIEVALLHPEDWAAEFVSPSVEAAPEGVRPGHLLRAEFDLDAGTAVRAARIHATAHGLYTLELNGRRVGDQELAPGWTSYRHRLRYQSYDVTELLRQGPNALGAELSDGWYRGRIGFHGGLWDNYGSDLSLLLQLELTLQDGSLRIVPLDHRWRTSSGPVVAASLYDGEHYDARLVPEGWSSPGFDDSGWATPTLLERTTFPAALEAPVGVPVRVIESLSPVAVEHRADGRIRLDFGQNIAGRLRIRPRGEAGTEVVLHHAEVLENDELAIRPLRSAPSVDRYVLKGDPAGEEWSPRFTVHGFRYAELEGWPGAFDATAVEALVVHSDMERTGWFDSSEPLVDRLHENTVWSMRDNFVDLPTDCPQRDERLGWTGDIQVFAPAASFLFDSAGTIASWLRDLGAEQSAEGAVPNFVPWIACGFPEASSAAWGDAAVIVPWTLYLRGGDLGVLEVQFPSMRAWVDHLAGMADSSGLIREGMQLGDWLDPAAPPEDPGAGITDKYLVASAYLAHSSRLTAHAAAVLGLDELAERYTALAEATATAFRQEYVTASGRMVNETPTSLSLALVFGLVHEPSQRLRAGRRLAELVREGGYRVQTGFVGTPVICDALASTGNLDDAYALLLERECPSWLYPVTQGATTIWERWDSMLPDGSVNPGEMTSFNHYALGAVVDFLHRTVAGLAPTAPGYRTFRVAPQPGGVFTRASARHRTPYGIASADWSLAEGRLRLDVEVPVGASAEIVLPDAAGTVLEVGSGTHEFLVDVHLAADRAAAA
ncbi:glycoside hydrolase family 78 protein [Herbiconiux sp. 11R-BC]|uniref:family 78 glycoside hydrolase catalytic domain n=1 Tax=Herbiconiux sp. 11R-BC TaxID=3111637 RepID=UPI003C112EFB